MRQRSCFQGFPDFSLHPHILRLERVCLFCPVLSLSVMGQMPWLGD